MTRSLPLLALPRTFRRRSGAARALPTALLARLRRRLSTASLDFSDAFDFRGLVADVPNWLAQLTERND